MWRRVVWWMDRPINVSMAPTASVSRNAGCRLLRNVGTVYKYSAPNSKRRRRLSDLFYDACQYFRRHNVEWYVRRWIMNWKGFARKWLWPNWCSIPFFAWRDWRKPRKYIRIADIPAYVSIGHLPNTNQRHFNLSQFAPFNHAIVISRIVQITKLLITHYQNNYHK
jgi:hypothetical protein